MTLSPQDRRAVIELAAEKLVERLIAEKGSLAELCLVPISVAESITGLDSRTLRQRMTFVEVAPKKHRVRISDIRALVENRSKVGLTK